MYIVIVAASDVVGESVGAGNGVGFDEASLPALLSIDDGGAVDGESDDSLSEGNMVLPNSLGSTVRQSSVGLSVFHVKLGLNVNSPVSGPCDGEELADAV